MNGRQRWATAPEDRGSILYQNDSASSSVDEEETGLYRQEPRSQLARRLSNVIAVHRPHYPSPLSQSPLQASLSSASRTAASIASSAPSLASTPTTSRSTASRFSITQEFDSLDDDDIHFFDTLIARLPQRASDFSQLKHAYNQLLAQQLQYRSQADTLPGAQERDNDWDAHLWSSLLSLVKVRGQNWRERWDSVRIALGLEPVSSAESSDDQDSHSQTLTDTEEDSALDTSDVHSTASTEHEHEHTNGAHTPMLPPRHALGLPSPRMSTVGPSQLGDHRRYSSLDGAAPVATPRGNRTDGRRRVPASTAVERTEATHALREGFSRLRFGTDRTEADIVDQTDLLGAAASTSRAVERLPTSARGRFDDFVRSSRLVRDNNRRTQSAAQEEEQEKRIGQQYKQADETFARHLLKTCLAWWIACTHRELDRTQHAVGANNQLILARAWDRWRKLGVQDHQALEVSRRTNEIRCKLTAFRRWKRRSDAVQFQRDDARKRLVRSAYYATAAGIKAKLVAQAFDTWRHRYATGLADAMRKHRLQAAGFGKWHRQTEQAGMLSLRAGAFETDLSRSVLIRAWTQWRALLEQKDAESSFRIHRCVQLLHTTLHHWRHITLLSRLAHAYTDRRLQSAAFGKWSLALQRLRASNKQSALAERWRARKVKETSIRVWTSRLHQLNGLNDLADQAVVVSENKLVHRLFKDWQLHGRSQLLARVWESRTLCAALYAWKQRHTSLVTALEQRESAHVEASRLTTLRLVFNRWKTIAYTDIELAKIADSHLSMVGKQSSFRRWRDLTLLHQNNLLLAVRASERALVGNMFDAWRDRFRDRKAIDARERHDVRLTQQVLEIWRTRATQRREEREKVSRMQALSARRTAQTALRWWVERVISIRGRELEIVEQRQRRVKWFALNAWVEALLRKDDLQVQMQVHVRAQEAQHKRRAMARWLARMRVQRDLRERESQFVHQQQRTLLLRQTWSTWTDKIADRELGQHEYAMLAVRHHLALQTAIRVWRQHSTLLPLVQRRNRSLKQHVVKHWNTALPYKHDANTAARMYQRQTLERAWETWLSRVRRNSQYRAASRYASVSANTSSSSFNLTMHPSQWQPRQRRRTLTLPNASVSPSDSAGRGGRTAPPSVRSLGRSSSPLRSSSPFAALYDRQRTATGRRPASTSKAYSTDGP